MDKVTLDGKIYEKSAVVAKRFGYTSDYIGQLSRADKIDAQLVGRSWYVHAPSVEEYQETLYEDDQVEVTKTIEKSATNRSENKTKINPKISTSRVNETQFEPESAAKKPSLRTSFSPTRTPQQSSSIPSSNWYRISYEPDSSELLPQLDKKAIDINVFEQSESMQKASKPGLRIHCDSPQFSIVDTVEKTPPERRHQTVAVEQIRTPRSSQGFTGVSDKTNIESEYTFETEDAKNSHNRLYLSIVIVSLAIIYTLLLLTLLSVRTVTYDASSGTFLYTFQIETFSTFWEAL